MTINKNPVGDVDYLGDRSLVGFIFSEKTGETKLYFSVYNYDFTGKGDAVNIYYKIDVTGKLTSWWYTYVCYSVKRRAAMIYLKLGDKEINHQIKSF